MPRTITHTVYEFEELNDKAKEKARDWYCGIGNEEWWDSTYSDAEGIGLKITGFDLNSPYITGDLTNSVEESCLKIIENHGKDCDTYKHLLGTQIHC